jgi:tRNA threonylcarbamoyladenosine biosynthesis protein TsaB
VNTSKTVNTSKIVQVERPKSVLSIETGTTYLALGLSVGDQHFSRVSEVGRTHAEKLPAELDAIFAEMHGAEADLPKHTDVIVVGTGPGSYTGLRVGASYALGLGRAWGVSVLGVPTLEALTHTEDGLLAVSLDARKEQVYGAVYNLQNGVVTQTVHAAAKYLLADFEALAAGLPWRRDVPPDPHALAWNALHHGLEKWELVYL